MVLLDLLGKLPLLTPEVLFLPLPGRLLGYEEQSQQRGVKNVDTATSKREGTPTRECGCLSTNMLETILYSKICCYECYINTIISNIIKY